MPDMADVSFEQILAQEEAREALMRSLKSTGLATGVAGVAGLGGVGAYTALKEPEEPTWKDNIRDVFT